VGGGGKIGEILDDKKKGRWRKSPSPAVHPHATHIWTPLAGIQPGFSRRKPAYN